MMSQVKLLDPSRCSIKLAQYAVGSSTAICESGLLPQVQEYRRAVSGQMLPLDPTQLHERIPSGQCHVSRKIDGEFTVLIVRSGQVFSINPGGTVRMGLPWQIEAQKQLSSHGIYDALLAGELYVFNDGNRERIHDVVSVARQPKSAADLDRLRFAVFDVLAINGQRVTTDFSRTFAQIKTWFGDGSLVHPVQAVWVEDTAGIEQCFQQWVVDCGAEGIVVRSQVAGTFKVKPRHNIDAVIVGYTESSNDRSGLLHDVLVAVGRPDGTLQILTRDGGGFSEQQRREMLSDLKDMVIESEYVEVNSDHVAYQMVRPEWVIEMSFLDLISQNTRGGTVNRVVLDFQKKDRQIFKVVRRMPLATVISPQFVRRREDKQANPQDIRIAQVAQRVEVPLADADAREFALPKSEIIRREVFTKSLKGETMARKFVLIQTNKDISTGEFPAFVVHYTDYSPNRKVPLAREVVVSNSRDQIDRLYDRFKEDNIKKGWEPYRVPLSMTSSSIAEADTISDASSVKPTKKVTKKSASKS